LKIGSGGLGGGAPPRCHRHIARRRGLHPAVTGWRKLYPTRVRIGGGAEAASEEGAQSQISIAEAVRIGGKPEGIRLGLIKESIAGVKRQAEIGIAEAGEQGPRISRGAGVGLARFERGRSSVEMA